MKSQSHFGKREIANQQTYKPDSKVMSMNVRCGRTDVTRAVVATDINVYGRTIQ